MSPSLPPPPPLPSPLCPVLSCQEERYKEVANEMKHMLVKVGWKGDFVEKSVPILPISGWMGDNLIKKSDKMPWWNGMTVDVSGGGAWVPVLKWRWEGCMARRAGATQQHGIRRGSVTAAPEYGLAGGRCPWRWRAPWFVVFAPSKGSQSTPPPRPRIGAAAAVDG
jgi:hypothetical protein